MPQYLSPGVYVEEVSSANRPIEAVSASVVGFAGFAPGGTPNKAVRVTNWTQFATTFADPDNPENGPFMEGAFLAHAVYGFFHNGGQIAYVVRVARDDRTPAPRAAIPAAHDKDAQLLRAVAREGITDGVTVEIREEGASEGKEASDITYHVRVVRDADVEEYEGLTLKKTRSNIATKVNHASKFVQFELDEKVASQPEARIAQGTFTLSTPAIAPGKVGARDFEGDVARRTGFGGFHGIDEISILAAPDLVSLNGDGEQLRDLQGKMIAHAENMGDRMVILDPPPGLLPQQVLDWRMNVAGYDSKMAAIYWPYIRVIDPISRQPIMVPPSGHMAGIWGRVDATRGVHKAPANEVVRGANGLEFQISQAEQGELNRVGINCIRAFPGRGIRAWGARTLSSDPEWRYINVRRIFNMITESIMIGTQWSVFEPNDRTLWTALRISVENFLTRVWQSGALFGATPGEAFFVKCDSETNPPESIEAGQVVCEIGISPVKPAEFVIFRLSQFTGGGGAEVTE